MSGITVTGHGRVAGRPDTMSITVGVSVARSAVGDAVNAAAEAASQVREAVTALGVAEGDIGTTGYTVAADHDPDDHRRIIGYRVEHTMTVTVRDLDGAGEILDAATASSGDDVLVGGVSFRIADDDRLLADARGAAWSDAKGKAEHLASLAGVELGAPENIAESLMIPRSPVPFRAAEASLAATTPITPGEHTVSVDLSVTFQIG